MAKRFLASEIWDKEWFMKLSPTEKCFFLFILSKCDNVGVWNPNINLAEIQIGSKIDFDLEDFCGHLELLPNGKYFVTEFCDFQYGELKETNKPHLSYIALLKKHGLLDRVSKGYTRGLEDPKDKDKDKDSISSINSNTKEILSYSICEPKNTAECFSMLDKLLESEQPRIIGLFASEAGIDRFRAILPKPAKDFGFKTEIAFLNRMRISFRDTSITDWTIPRAVDALCDLAEAWKNYWIKEKTDSKFLPTMTGFFEKPQYSGYPE